MEYPAHALLVSTDGNSPQCHHIYTQCYHIYPSHQPALHPMQYGQAFTLRNVT